MGCASPCDRFESIPLTCKEEQMPGVLWVLVYLISLISKAQIHPTLDDYSVMGTYKFPFA